VDGKSGRKTPGGLNRNLDIEQFEAVRLESDNKEWSRRKVEVCLLVSCWWVCLLVSCWWVCLLVSCWWVCLLVSCW
jgi:hypothetical protein